MRSSFLRRFALPLALLWACTEYDLSKESRDRPGGRQDSGDDPVTDTDEDSGGDNEDSGGGTVDDSDGGDSGTPDVPSGKIDVVLLVDVSYFYDCYHADLAVEGSALVTALLSSGADVAVAIATFDDYQVEGEWWAGWDGLPYSLEQQLTTDQSRLQSVTSRLELEWGGDGPGSAYEALVQATEGNGYDQDCDGSLDATTDIQPYRSSSTDAFGGGAGSARDGSTPGTGATAGVGFRDNSTRIVVLLTENAIRDRALGDSLPSGSCPSGAGKADAIAAINAAGAKFLGVNAYEFQDEDTNLQGQLEDLANGTSSRIDADSDGAEDDVAVLSGSWDWPETSVIVTAIWDLAD